MMPKQPDNSDKNNKSSQIIAAGIPRSGSTMMYQVLAALFPSIRITKTHDFIKETHAKIVVTYRDFRDVAVSFARVVRSQKKQPYQDKITRKELESYIKTILQRIDVLDNYNSLAFSSKRVLLMRYELLFNLF
jgi:Sulfotransferase domain